MNSTLVKIDVASADLGLSAARVFELVDGGTTKDQALVWVFNLAHKLDGHRRDLRFWRSELRARGQGDASHCRLKIGQVIALILPERRTTFHAGEVDMLFQLRPRCRIDYGRELAGYLASGAHVYSRPALADFLQRRWIGAALVRPALGRKGQTS